MDNKQILTKTCQCLAEVHAVKQHLKLMMITLPDFA